MERLVLIRRGFAVLALCLLAVPASAHGGEPRINPSFVPLSIASVVFWGGALIGLYGFHSRRKRAHAASGLETPYRARGLAPGLVGLVLLASASAMALRSMRFEAPDSDSRMRGNPEEAVDALSMRLYRLPENERVPYLIGLLGDPSPGLRFAASDQLGDFRGPEVADALEGVFANDSYAMARERAMEVLPTVDRERGLNLLARALRDPDTELREAAILQLGGLLQRRPRVNGRRDTAGDRRFLPLIAPSLDDPSPIVSAATATLMGRLSGQNWRVRSRATKEEQTPVLDACRAWWALHKAEFSRGAPPTGVAPPAAAHSLRADPAPDYAFRDLDGKTVSREGQKGRVTLLNFWGTWCGPCRAELPGLVRIAKEYRDKPLDLIGLAVGERDGAAGLRRWCEERSIPYRQALSPHEIQDAFGRIEDVPVTILIDQRGRIRNRWDGAHEESTFRAAIDRLLAETPIAR
jgi:thiol-disulfide isomerase/thioredoxin